MYSRPAGLSDDESDDEGFSFYDEESSNRKRPGQTLSEVESVNKATRESCLEEEEQDLQFRVMHACMAGQLDQIITYIDCHNVDDYLNSGWTPLLYAASSVHPEVVEYLLSVGADPNKHRDGFTPLMALCNANTGTTERCLKCFELLVAAKGNVNATNKYNETALMLACKGNKPELITELLKYVDDVNFTNIEGKSALFYAVTGNMPAILKILLEHGADITIADKHNYTARDIAIAKGFEKLAPLLSTESDVPLEISETIQSYTWRDMFPMLCGKTEKCVNFDVATILYGMGMERYKCLFEGVDLKTFLRLTEDDLVRLGLDMPFQRKQFLEGLHKFHVHKWSMQSIGSIRKGLPYTIYDGVISLGHAAKQIGVISSSIRFIKNSLIGAREKNLELSDREKLKYSGELKKTQESLLSLEKELKLIKNIARKTNKEIKLNPPADYIGSKKRKSNWTIIVGITLIVGIYFSRTTYIRRIWND